MALLYNLARQTSTTTGTSDITLGTVVPGYLTFATAGAANGQTIAYGIKDGANSEVGTAVFSSGVLGTRTPSNSTNGGAAISLSGASQVYITARSQDLLSVSETRTANTFLSGPVSGAAATPTFRALDDADLPVGSILQLLQTSYTTNTSIAVAIPVDDTIPGSAEGTQILSQAITPYDNSNRIWVSVDGFGACSQQDTSVACSVFRGATCIIAEAQESGTNTGFFAFNLALYDSPASSAAQTYTVRVGPTSSAFSIRMNGSASGRLLGGVAAVTITVAEVAV